MITINDEKITFEIEHPFPQEFINDLKNAIITSVQNQSYEISNIEEIQDSNYYLLEVLKSMI